MWHRLNKPLDGKVSFAKIACNRTPLARSFSTHPTCLARLELLGPGAPGRGVASKRPGRFQALKVCPVSLRKPLRCEETETSLPDLQGRHVCWVKFCESSLDLVMKAPQISSDHIHAYKQATQLIHSAPVAFGCGLRFVRGPIELAAP